MLILHRNNNKVVAFYVGEGIHHAMESGKMASAFLQEAIEAGNYGEHVMAHFQDRWMAKFGSDFTW